MLSSSSLFTIAGRLFHPKKMLLLLNKEYIAMDRIVSTRHLLTSKDGKTASPGSHDIRHTYIAESLHKLYEIAIIITENNKGAKKEGTKRAVHHIRCKHCDQECASFSAIRISGAYKDIFDKAIETGSSLMKSKWGGSSYSLVKNLTGKIYYTFGAFNVA